MQPSAGSVACPDAKEMSPSRQMGLDGLGWAWMGLPRKTRNRDANIQPSRFQPAHWESAQPFKFPDRGKWLQFFFSSFLSSHRPFS
jgi:hypothetical protein